MDISVIIPTYKPREYLWECLASLVKQTFPKKDFEVVLVLNGCTEPWRGEIENYIATKMCGMNINFIHTGKAGVSNARNVALSVARGKFVAFIDDDDYVSPSYLEELYQNSSLDTIGLCYPYAFRDGDLQQLPYSITDIYNKLSKKGIQPYPRARKYFSGPCMKLIPMSFIQDRRFNVNFRNGEDSLFMFYISDKFGSVAFTSESAVYYRRYRVNSAVTSKRSIKCRLYNKLNMFKEYLRIYWGAPTKYNFCFFLTRVLALLR